MDWLALATLLCVAAAGAILVLMGALILIEWLQDSLYDRLYRRQQQRRLAATDGWFECQYCGNRRVQSFEKFCSVCGKHLS